MKCKNCKRRFNEAGNIINYKIVCPHCKYIQKEEFNLSEWVSVVNFNGEWLEMIIDEKVKEFIRIVEWIIIKRESRRLQLIALGKAMGDKFK